MTEAQRTCLHVWVANYWWDEPPTQYCPRCGIDRGDYEHDAAIDTQWERAFERMAAPHD